MENVMCSINVGIVEKKLWNEKGVIEEKKKNESAWIRDDIVSK